MRDKEHELAISCNQTDFQWRDWTINPATKSLTYNFLPIGCDGVKVVQMVGVADQ